MCYLPLSSSLLLSSNLFDYSPSSPELRSSDNATINRISRELGLPLPQVRMLGHIYYTLACENTVSDVDFLFFYLLYLSFPYLCASLSLSSLLCSSRKLALSFFYMLFRLNNLFKVMIKWATERGTVCLPRSNNFEHIFENLSVTLVSVPTLSSITPHVEYLPYLLFFFSSFFLSFFLSSLPSIILFFFTLFLGNLKYLSICLNFYDRRTLRFATVECFLV